MKTGSASSVNVFGSPYKTDHNRSCRQICRSGNQSFPFTLMYSTKKYKLSTYFFLPCNK